MVDKMTRLGSSGRRLKLEKASQGLFRGPVTPNDFYHFNWRTGAGSYEVGHIFQSGLYSFILGIQVR